MDKFEQGLEQELLRMCRSLGMLGDMLLASEDIDGKWKEFAPEYMAEAVKNVNEYPEFSVACAAYAGMAVAHWWDEDWGRHHSCHLSDLYGSRGFDDMDDHIVADVLALGDPVKAGVTVKTVECLSQGVWTYIRSSAIERGTADAFNAFARACAVMFRVGAGIELKRLGYRYQAVNLGSGKPVS